MESLAVEQTIHAEFGGRPPARGVASVVLCRLPHSVAFADSLTIIVVVAGVIPIGLSSFSFLSSFLSSSLSSFLSPLGSGFAPSPGTTGGGGGIGGGPTFIGMPY